MRRVFRIFPAVTGMFLLCVSTAFGSPAAYLSSPVNSTAGLVAEVQADPAALADYADHFGMSREAVLKYLGSLHFELLPSDGMYPVFAPAAPDAKLAILTKGEPVFAEMSGRVILRASDGAALAATEGNDTPFGGSGEEGSTLGATSAGVIPGSAAAGSPTAAAAVTSTSDTMPSMPGASPSAAAVPAAAAAGGSPGASLDDTMEWGDGVNLSGPVDLAYSQNPDSSDDYGPLVSQISDAGTSPAVDDPSDENLFESYIAQTPPAPPGGTSGAGSGGTALGILAGLGLTIALFDHSGGGGSSPRPAVTPEPAPVLVFGVGLGVLAARRRSAKRSRK